LLSRQLPKPNRIGRPREVDLRTIMDAILYILATGCQWRALPKDFPPFTTVQHYFYDWRDRRVWQRINRTLVERARQPSDTRRLSAERLLEVARQVSPALPSDTRDPEAMAFALQAMLIGTLQLARAVQGTALSDRILAADADAARARPFLQRS